MERLVEKKLNDVLKNLIISIVDDDIIYYYNNKNNFILLKEVIIKLNNEELSIKYNIIRNIIKNIDCCIDYNKNKLYSDNNNLLEKYFIKIIDDILNIINKVDEHIYINILYEDTIFIKEFITEDLFNLFITIYNILNNVYNK